MKKGKSVKYPPLEQKDRIYYLAGWPGMRPLDDRTDYVKEEFVLTAIARRMKVHEHLLYKSAPLSDGSYTVMAQQDNGPEPVLRPVANVKPWPKGKQ